MRDGCGVIPEIFFDTDKSNVTVDIICEQKKNKLDCDVLIYLF